MEQLKELSLGKCKSVDVPFLNFFPAVQQLITTFVSMLSNSCLLFIAQLAAYRTWEEVVAGFEPWLGLFLTEDWWLSFQWHSFVSIIWLCYELNPFQDKPWLLCVFTYKPFKNIVRKVEIARNEQFLLFPHCFLPVWRTFCRLYRVCNCCLQTLSVLE